MAEIAGTGKTHLLADLADGDVAVFQKPLAFANSPVQQVADGAAPPFPG